MMADAVPFPAPAGGEAKPKKEKVAKAPPPGGYAKKPELSKAERRELQEKQRAAKAAGGGGKGDAKKPQPPAPPTGKPSTGEGSQGSAGTAVASAPGAENVAVGPKPLFGHLPPFSAKSTALLSPSSGALNDVHPAVAALGLRMADGSVRGADARCVAMLEAMKQVVNDYVTPPDKALERDLHKKVDRSFQFLTDCRAHSISMGNAKQFLRGTIATLPPGLSEAEAKATVVEEIDRFISERVVAAGKLIAILAADKIRPSGDVILTFGRSHTVEQLFVHAHTTQKKQFHVVVCDSRPDLEGVGLLERLTQLGVHCTYVLITALSYVMPHVTKCVLGSAAITSNGAVQGRCGTAAVALAAHKRNVPVLFTCETYKLCDKVSLDSIVANELGDPRKLQRPKFAYSSAGSHKSSSSGGPNSNDSSGTGDAVNSNNSSDTSTAGSSKKTSPRLLNLQFDLTPIKFVGMVVTEVGLIPPTAVPALLREYRKESGDVLASDL